MASFKKGQRQFENVRLTGVEFEFLSTLQYRAAHSELLLAWSERGWLREDNPSPTFGTGHARARNAIGHRAIILRHQRAPSSTLALSLSLPAGRIFRLRVHFGWGTSSRLPNLRHPGPRHAVAVGCDYRRSSGCRPEHVLARAFDGNHLSAYTERCGPAPRPIPACDRCVISRSKTPLAAKRSSARKTPWPRYPDRRNRRPLHYLK